MPYAPCNVSENWPDSACIHEDYKVCPPFVADCCLRLYGTLRKGRTGLQKRHVFKYLLRSNAMKNFKKLFLSILTAAFVAVPAQADEILMMATTTSTQDTGLLEFLAPSFQEETGIELRWVAVGTGKALEIAKNCDADVLLVHAPAAEKEFVKAGHGIDRRQVMYNDFVLVGPKADTAGVTGMDTAVALKTIAAKKAGFVSRGDQSGTHKAELGLWKQAGLNPDREAFYISAGQGMMATLNMAAEKGAYCLTDRGTWIKFNAQQGDKNPLTIVVEGDEALFNQYSVITVNPEQCPNTKADLGKKFEDWWVSPATQKRIADFRLEDKQLFFPNADR